MPGLAQEQNISNYKPLHVSIAFHIGRIAWELPSDGPDYGRRGSQG